MLNTVEKVLLLQELKVFREATSEQLANLAINTTHTRFPKTATSRKGPSCSRRARPAMIFNCWSTERFRSDRRETAG